MQDVFSSHKFCTKWQCSQSHGQSFRNNCPCHQQSLYCPGYSYFRHNEEPYHILDLPVTDFKLRTSHLPKAPSLEEKDITEAYLNIDGVSIRYITFGHGPKVLFFTYGVLGEIRNSFKRQLTEFDPNLFTSIYWDPPGYGKSLPRDRNFIPYYYIEEDTCLAYKLLSFLKINKVSLFGWCDGGNLSVLFAVQHPEMVEKLVLWGTKAWLTKENLRVFDRMRRLSNWSPVARTETLKAYNNDSNYITNVFNRYVDTINIYYRDYSGNIFWDLLSYVAAPTLVFHSADDVMVSSQQARDLTREIRLSSLHMFSSGGHSCHIKHWEEFNKISTSFILS